MCYYKKGNKKWFFFSGIFVVILNAGFVYKKGGNFLSSAVTKFNFQLINNKVIMDWIKNIELAILFEIICKIYYYTIESICALKICSINRRLM